MEKRKFWKALAFVVLLSGCSTVPEYFIDDPVCRYEAVKYSNGDWWQEEKIYRLCKGGGK